MVVPLSGLFGTFFYRCECPTDEMPVGRLPDLVRDTRLEAEFKDGTTIHSYTTSDTLRRVKKQKVYWQKEKEIGKGGFSSVHLETRKGLSVVGQPELRAVKRIRHASHRDWVHELEAVAKFSIERVCHWSMVNMLKLLNTV
jgi:hypothetical protein